MLVEVVHQLATAAHHCLYLGVRCRNKLRLCTMHMVRVGPSETFLSAAERYTNHQVDKEATVVLSRQNWFNVSNQWRHSGTRNEFSSMDNICYPESIRPTRFVIYTFKG